MSVYIIGDVQGCYHELQQLLEKIKFDPTKDRLGFVGDLVNRGPQSLEVLRFIKSLNNPIIVLGNHDLYCLILGYGLMPEDAYQHTLQTILRAPDRIELLDWLRQQPLIHQEQHNLLVHAGIPPQWSIAQSIAHAEEVHQVLRGPNYGPFLTHLFGNEPATWQDHLTGQARWRYIVNALTRMRFCDQQGGLDLMASGQQSTDPQRFAPWFEQRAQHHDDSHIIFGHWAALNGQCHVAGFYALDTGCAWGHELTALCLDNNKRYTVDHHI